MRIRPLILMMSVPAILAGASVVAQAQPEAPPTRQLMPVPASVRWGSGRLPVTPSFAVHVAKVTEPRLERAIDRMSRRLEGRLGFEIPRGRALAREDAALVVEVDRSSPALPGLGDDEAYALDVTATQAVLRAPTVVGAVRGLETVLQLLEGDREGWFLPVVTIEDRPRFTWRGLMIDVGRHWLPIEVIKRNLDGMAALKLNVLHLHLTEDQGFRIESRKFPRLHQLGSDGLYFTQDQIREIVAYAAERGIRVVPEFDMPGHVTAWLVGHPELGSAPGPYQIERKWGIFDPAFDPTREDLYKFLDTFFGEMSTLFPDAYLHIGGDENNGNHWAANGAIQAFMKKQNIADAHALQAYFNQRLLRILQKYRKRMVGWDEILHPDLPKDAVIHSWRGQAALAESAKLGYQGILSNGYYIDLMQPTWRHYAVDPLPAGHALTAEEASRVLGGEATMWAEWVTPETVDSRVWPRTAAIAERFWSARDVQDVDDMYRRLGKVTVDLEELGLLHLKNPSMLLRRMTGGADTHALAMLAGLVEPVEEYRRGREFTRAHGTPATQQWPLTRLVDAAGPDSLETRRLARAIDRLLDDAPLFERGREELLAAFEGWRANAPALERLIDRRPILREVGPLANDLLALAAAGREAVDVLASRTAPASGWRDRLVKTLDAAAEPKAEVELPIVSALRRLVFGAAMVGEVGAVLPSEWKKKVLEAAAPPPPPSRR